jgi:hypothetical protein
VGGLVAVATAVLHRGGRLGLALVLTVFLVAYAVLGVLLTPVVALVLALLALPYRLHALARLGMRRRRPLLRRLTGAPRPWTMPPT